MSRPRIRSLKPEAWQDERIGALSRDARLLFVGLITMADDEGRLRAQPSMVIGHVFPWDDISPRKLAEWLEEITAQRLVERYEIDGRPYIAFRNWKRHQRINRPTASELPPPMSHAIARGNSVNDHGTAPTISSVDITPSRGRGSDQDRKGKDPPQPPEQARGEQPPQDQASPVRANPRARGTNPRAVTKLAEAVEAEQRAATAAGALSAAGDEDRAAWGRLQAVMRSAVGDDSSAWTLYVEPLSLAGVIDGELVIDGPAAAWGWHRVPRLVEQCSDHVGVRARLATRREHEGLERVAA